MRALPILAVVLAACSRPDLERARTLEQASRWHEATQAYADVLRSYPYDREAASAMARIYCFRVHHPDRCIAWSEKLRDIYPSDPEHARSAAHGYRERAQLRRERGDRTGAADDEARARGLAPK